jgi:plastocyanin
MVPQAGGASGLPPGGTFIDDDGHIFEGAIEAIAAEGITKGCNPPVNDKFCPNDEVTRGEMAVFLVRAMGYIDNGGGNLFIDDDGLFYENSADRLKTAKVTLGCNPPVNDKFCPNDEVTRGEMAVFLVRAMGYTDNGGGNLFTDDDGHLFENAIDKLGTAKVTLGCNPPDNDHFCPDDFVTRGQMAAFLSRALGLTPMKPPPRETTTTTTQGSKTVSGSMFSFGYNPDPIVINVGDTVRWTNNSGINHTTTLFGNWNSGSLTTGASFSEVFDSSGTFNYFCTIHGAVLMSGVVVVNP